MGIGEPQKCGMCGYAIIPGLMFNDKKAKQAMTPIAGFDFARKKYFVVGRIHVDRELCKSLADREGKPFDTEIRTTTERGSNADVGEQSNNIQSD